MRQVNPSREVEGVEGTNGFGATEVAGLLLRRDAPIRKAEWLIAQARDQLRSAQEIAIEITPVIQERKPGETVTLETVAEGIENALAFILTDEDFSDWNKINEAAKREVKEQTAKAATELARLKKEARARHRKAKEVGNEARDALDRRILLTIREILERDAKEPMRDRIIWKRGEPPFSSGINGIMLDQLVIELSEEFDEKLIITLMPLEDLRERVKTVLRKRRLGKR